MIRDYARSIVEANNRFNKDAREHFYNTGAYLHLEDRHALNQAFYAMLGSKDKEEKLATIVCSHADQQPIGLTLDVIKSLKDVHTILLSKLSEKKKTDAKFARAVTMIESQSFYFDERMLVFDFMRDILTEIY